MRIPIQVLVYPVRASENHGREYLLLHRLPTRGDFWQGVTGGVEAGEVIIDAAKREMIEETGVVPVTIHKVDYSYSFPVGDKWRHLYDEGVEEITEYVFVAQVEGDQAPTPDAREHDQWQWLPFEQALQQLTWPGNIEALRRCDRFMSDRSF